MGRFDLRVLLLSLLTIPLTPLTEVYSGEFHKLNSEKISRGDHVELDLAFLELSRSDGARAEELDIDIGRSITASPKVFLRMYKRHKRSVSSLGALVGNLGPRFVDAPDRQVVELRRRIRALESVRDAELKEVASACITELTKVLGTLSP